MQCAPKSDLPETTQKHCKATHENGAVSPRTGPLKGTVTAWNAGYGLVQLDDRRGVAVVSARELDRFDYFDMKGRRVEVEVEIEKRSGAPQLRATSVTLLDELE
jgi:hypothetical protein